jgi:hypothetical protein
LAPLAASLLAFSQPASAQPASTQPAFSDDVPLTSDTGQVPLAWQADGPVHISMAKGSGPRRAVFGGSGEQLFLSGLSDGDYTLTIAPEGGAATDSIQLEVRHQSLTRALLLTLLGGVVFLLILAIILRGARRD